jgi:excinuclease UvrABC nuclease subunit
MVRADVKEFIRSHGLLHDVGSESGIYAITIDGYVAFVGKSKEMQKECFRHISRALNKTPLSRKKYRILGDAWINKHAIDCKMLERCSESELDAKEKEMLKKYDPPLNTRMPDGPRDIRELTLQKLMTILKKRVK